MMKQIIFQVSGMTCGHCVKAVENAVNGLEGIEQIDVQLNNGTVKVTFDPARADEMTIKNAIEDQGYDVSL